MSVVLTGWSSDVRVINLRKSSQPDVTEATELSILVNLSMALFSFSRSSDNVSATQQKCNKVDNVLSCFIVVTTMEQGNAIYWFDYNHGKVIDKIDENKYINGGLVFQNTRPDLRINPSYNLTTTK